MHIDIREELELESCNDRELKMSEYIAIKNIDSISNEADSLDYPTHKKKQQCYSNNFNSISQAFPKQENKSHADTKEDVAFSFAGSANHKICESEINHSCKPRENTQSLRKIQEIHIEFKSKCDIKFLTIKPSHFVNGKLVFGYDPDIIGMKLDDTTSKTLPGIDFYLPFEFRSIVKKTKLFELTLLSNKLKLNPHVLPQFLFQLRASKSKPWPLRDEAKFLLGDMLFKINIQSQLKLIVISRIITRRYPERISLTCSQSDGVVRIGRHQSCNLHFDSMLLSRVHASILYDNQNECWVIYDGEQGKPSVNGCFMLCEAAIEVDGTAEFKLNENIIKISIIESLTLF